MIKNVFIYGFSPKVLNIFTQMLMSKIDLYIFTSEKPYFIILLIILIKHLASYYKPQYLLQYQSDKCFNGTVVNPALHIFILILTTFFWDFCFNQYFLKHWPECGMWKTYLLSACCTIILVQWIAMYTLSTVVLWRHKCQLSFCVRQNY